VVVVIGALARLTWLAISLLRLGRLRSAGETAPPCKDRDGLQRALGVRAEIRYVAGLRQPVTFGVRWPVVLLPAGILDQPSEIQRAVLCHELVHVERRDWAWVLVEEVVRAIFWFHPAIWWVVSRVQLAREEVVDLRTVRITGGRRSYIEALMAFADGTPLAQAAAFSRRRHLFRRILLLSKDRGMSARRRVAWSAVMALVLAAGSWRAISAFPLLQSPAGGERGAPLDHGTPPSPTVRGTDDRSPIGGPPAPPPPSVQQAPVPEMAPRRADTPRTGLEGVDELTRRLQQRAAPTPAAPLESRTVAALAAPAPVAAAPVSPETTGPSDGGLTGGAEPEPREVVPLRVGGRIPPPRKIKDVRPLYPPIAASARVSGIVIVEATIGADGRVTDARVIRSIPLLDQAAVDAVRQWEFTPTLLNGAPTPIVMSVTVNFNFTLQN
jgi:protein TonB